MAEQEERLRLEELAQEKQEEERLRLEAEKKKQKPKEPKVTTIKEPLEFDSKVVDLLGLTTEQLEASKEKLKALDEVDRIKKERETSLNDLESFVLDVREKLYDELFEKSSTEEEREKIREKVRIHCVTS